MKFGYTNDSYVVKSFKYSKYKKAVVEKKIEMCNYKALLIFIY